MLRRMAPTIRYRIENQTGVRSKVLAEYEARGWLPSADSTAEGDYLWSLRLVRLLREGLTPRQVDVVMNLLGAERRDEMPKSASETIDLAVGEMLRADPMMTKQRALRELGTKHPELFEAQRQEGLDKSAAGRQAFAEAQSRCRILGAGSTALAAASRVVDSEPVRGTEPAPPSTATRTMEEISRMVGEEMKRNPKLSTVEARRRIFAAHPALYLAHRAATTRAKGGPR
jgi:hypothetical protein